MGSERKITNLVFFLKTNLLVGSGNKYGCVANQNFGIRDGNLLL